MNKIAHLWLLASLLLMPTGTVYADDGTPHDRIVIGQNFTLSSGEIVDGDLVVIAGETSIEQGAVVSGDLVVIGASLRLDGTARGSAVVIGGSASLGNAASVGKDLVALGGNFQRADGSRIAGDIITNRTIEAQRTAARTEMPPYTVPPPPEFKFDFGPLGTLVSIFFQALFLGGLAMLLTALLHPQLDRVALTVRTQPFAAGSFGLLTVFVAPLALIVMAVTLILIPLALASVLLLVLAWLFGIVALGQIVGEGIVRAMHRTWEPVLTAGFGAFVLAIGLGAANQVPCIGWLASILAGLMGLGAATMTLFGTRAGIRVPAALPPTDVNGPQSLPPAAA